MTDVEQFEQEASLTQRLPGDNVYDVLVAAARAHGERIALRMLMTGADAEVVVEHGGSRGMIVNITLAQGAGDVQRLQEILNGYLFETRIRRV